MRRLLPVVVIAGLVFMTGCASDPGTSSLRENDWHKVARGDLQCDGDVRVTNTDYYDLNDDHVDEAFVTMRCADRRETQGDSLEVFDGNAGSDPKWAKRLVMQRAGLTVDHVCFRGGWVIFETLSRSTRKVQQASLDEKSRLKQTPLGRDSKLVTRADSGPGCPNVS